jgi:hypothetical protein
MHEPPANLIPTYVSDTQARRLAQLDSTRSSAQIFSAGKPCQEIVPDFFALIVLRDNEIRD